jgi:hypothetical protein
MKLKDIKHLIDAHFDALAPMELIRRLESLGYEFEPIKESYFPQTVADFSEVANNNRFESTFDGKAEAGVLYLDKKETQSATPTDYAHYQYAMAA